MCGRIVKKSSLLIMSLASLAGTLHSQERPPELLLRAAQCLVAKSFLQTSKASKLTFGYLLDEKSYPVDKVIYVVNYEAPTRSNGLVFAVFLSGRNSRQKFNIQNNASFVLSKNAFGGVSYVDSPLWGIWTQEHLSSAIRLFVLDHFRTRAISTMFIGERQSSPSIAPAE